jgi:putative membrane protein
MTEALILASDHGWWHGGGGWWWALSPLSTIVVLAAIGLGAWLLIRGLGGGGGTHRARQLLHERYARGEISTDEYVERLNQLV